MPNNTINLFDTYTMMALMEEVAPVPSFFKDRYFKTGPEDIFLTKKVLMEFSDGDYQMAPIVSRSVGDIPVERDGYEVYELEPAYVGISKYLTADDLEMRGFGEALFANEAPATRAAKLMMQDFTKLNNRITRREEWISVQTMLNNACEMQEYVDANTVGDKSFLCFYENKDEHKYVVDEPITMDTPASVVIGHIVAICDKLTERGLPVEDLVVGDDVAAIFRGNKDLRELFSKTSGINIGNIKEQRIPGAVHMGSVNFGGYTLDVFNAKGIYKDASGVIRKYFPKNAVLATAPDCGHMMYGSITQKEFGAAPEAWFTRTGTRIPKLKVDVNNDTQCLRLACKPVAAPRNRTPWIVAENFAG